MSVKAIVAFLVVFIVGVGAGQFMSLGSDGGDDVAPTVASASPSLAEADVNRIIEAYIMENPTVIMRSVDEYQRGGSLAQIEERAVPFLATLQEAENAGVIGAASADVKIIEFFDYQCPHCKANFDVLRRLLDEDASLALMPKYLPILGDGSADDMSHYAARAAEASRLQGKFAAFHESLMASQLPISRDSVEAVARGIGVDVGQMHRDMESAIVVQAVNDSRAIADDIGISAAGTPGYIIGGKVIIGASPDSYDRMKAMIADARRGG